jgi:septum formation protein
MPVLAADTTVALGGTILGKPKDAEDASRMLTLLSGRTHRVLTAVVLARGDRDRLEQCITVSRVRFARLSRNDIERYVESGEPMDKAGAYAIQGGAAAFVKTIEGSYTGIVGLPLYETLRLLRRAGRSPLGS